jgi:beta-lactamase class A
MGFEMTRRAAIVTGAAAAAVGAVGAPALAAPAPGTDRDATTKIQNRYAKQSTKAGGNWYSHVALIGADASVTPIIEDEADFVVHGYSVQKLFVATAVLDKVDRGALTMDTKVTLTPEIILGGSGIYHLQKTYGDQLTVAGFLTALLLVSDNTAVRLCGLVCPAAEINATLEAKGFVHSRVEPVANPNRFFLGVTTPRETHDLLHRLSQRTLLSSTSSDFLLRILRWTSGYHDGIRRNMSSLERDRVATKYGADFNTLGASRHEAGIMFGSDGAPVLTYAFFAEGLADRDNYGATHPAVEAHAVLGRVMFDTVAAASAPSARAKQPLSPYNYTDTA